MNRAAAKPRRELISKRERRSRASGDGNETRGRGERFDRTKEIHGPRQFDGRSNRCRPCSRQGGGQHESNRSDERAFRIMTARHGANHHSRHFMIAIHVIRGRSGSLLVMMRGNFALARHAAGGLIGRPRGRRQRRIEQNDREQADACGDRTAAILTHSLHVACKPISVVRHYIVMRHSLQAKKLAACAPVQYTPDTAIFALRFSASHCELLRPEPT